MIRKDKSILIVSSRNALAEEGIIGEKVIGYAGLNQMVKEKLKQLKDWLQKRGIVIDVHPAISFFGIITVSAGEIEINPDKWNKEEEEKVTAHLQKTANISIEDYQSLLKEAIETKTEEEIAAEIENILGTFKAEIKDIVKYIHENPFLTIEEFKGRTENKAIDYTFVARAEELEELNTFWNNSDEEIKVIVGEGGLGKTRLAIEFAQKLTESHDCDVFFIHPYNYFTSKPFRRKTLLILDEALQYPYRDKAIDFVLHHPSTDEDIRLLLIGRSGFKEPIVRDLREKGKHIAITELKKSPIAEFLRENFQEIEEDKAREIAKSSRNNFVDAIFNAEHFLKKGEVVSSLDVLAERVEKYIDDIAYSTGNTKKDVREIIDVLSLITPLKWEVDKGYLKEAFFSGQYKVFEDIIQEVRTASTDILVLSERDYVFKFDRFADYLRSEFITKEKFKEFWLPHLLCYMPFRISFNIFVLPRFKRVVAQKAAEILNEIWRELNTSGGKTPEYFAALVIFTGVFAPSSRLNLNEIDIDIWMRYYENLSRTYPEKEMRGNLARSLFNVADLYRRLENFEQMEMCVNTLSTLHTNHPGKEVRESLARGLYNIVRRYENANMFRVMETWLKKLVELHKKFPEKAVRIPLAMGLTIGMHYYGRLRNFELMDMRLKELIYLHGSYPEKEVRENLAMSLSNAVQDYGRAEKFELMETCLEKLTLLHSIYSEEKVGRSLARGLYNAMVTYGATNKFGPIETCLKKLIELHKKFPDKEVREILAMCLLNTIYHYGTVAEFELMETYLKELIYLHGSYPEKEVRESLAMALFNTITFYLWVNELPKVGEHIEELYKLSENYPEKEVKVNLKKGLQNAIILSKDTNYDILLLLFKLRLDLPEDQYEHENVEYIESLLINKTVEIMESEYNKGEKHLKDFVQKIKEKVGGDNAIILMNGVSNRLHLKAQKVIWELFNL